MTPMLDTLVWLINFPARNGFAMVFLAVFGGMGLIAAARRRGGQSSRVQQLREEAGLDVAETPHPMRDALRRVQQWVYGIVAGVVIAGGAIGVLSLIGVDLVKPYIAANGETVTGSYDGNFVTFTTERGVEYTQPVSFMTSPIYPDRWSFMSSSDPVSITYLPQHPQAFVVNSEPYE